MWCREERCQGRALLEGRSGDGPPEALEPCLVALSRHVPLAAASSHSGLTPRGARGAEAGGQSGAQGQSSRRHGPDLAAPGRPPRKCAVRRKSLGGGILSQPWRPGSPSCVGRGRASVLGTVMNGSFSRAGFTGLW